MHFDLSINVPTLLGLLSVGVGIYVRLVRVEDRQAEHEKQDGVRFDKLDTYHEKTVERWDTQTNVNADVLSRLKSIERRA